MLKCGWNRNNKQLLLTHEWLTGAKIVINVNEITAFIGKLISITGNDVNLTMPEETIFAKAYNRRQKYLMKTNFKEFPSLNRTRIDGVPNESRPANVNSLNENESFIIVI